MSNTHEEWSCGCEFLNNERTKACGDHRNFKPGATGFTGTMKTIADRADAIYEEWDNRTITREDIARILTAVRDEGAAEEREACAAIADQGGDGDDIAADIRSRARGTR